MAKIEFGDIDKYAKDLGILFKDSQKIIEAAVYQGANVVADEIKEGIRAIPVDNRIGTKENQLKGITNRQKADLIDAFGLSPMRNDGDYINTKAGFDGYGSIETAKYPKGVPNAALMRSVESGTSFRKKIPTIRPAVNRVRKKAQEAMDEELNRQIKERME